MLLTLFRGGRRSGFSGLCTQKCRHFRSARRCESAGQARGRLTRQPDDRACVWGSLRSQKRSIRAIWICQSTKMHMTGCGHMKRLEFHELAHLSVGPRTGNPLFGGRSFSVLRRRWKSGNADSPLAELRNPDARQDRNACGNDYPVCVESAPLTGPLDNGHLGMEPASRICRCPAPRSIHLVAPPA